MFALQVFLVIWFAATLAMSMALVRIYPRMDSWLNVSRSIAWPVTLLESYWGMIED